MKAIGYIRVSTDDQALGLEAQEAQIREWCTRENHELVQIFSDEGVSGATPLEKRKAMPAALAALKRGMLLVAVKRDRFARDPAIMILLDEQAKRSGAKLVTLDGVGAVEGPTGQLMAGIIDMFSRFERSLIKERTSAALRAKIAKGEAAGGTVPYGWRAVPDPTRTHPKTTKPILLLEEDPREQECIQFLLELRALGYSVRKIVERLEASGYPARGSRWHPTSVFRILDSHAPPGLCAERR